MTAADGCRVIFDEKRVRDISARSRDAYDVNLAMMDAYLDDGVDYYLLEFPRERSASQTPTWSRSLAVIFTNILSFNRNNMFTRTSSWSME